MNQWTDSAREELERGLQRTRAGMTADGMDPDEVVQDLRRHVEEELNGTDSQVVTADDVRRILTRMGEPPRDEDPALPVAPPAPDRPRFTARTWALFALTVAFGVVVPAIALGLELVAGLCRDILFDPLPTVWHACLIGVVPLANLMACVALRRAPSTGLRALSWLNAVAIGVSFYYSLMFLPIAPFALVAILYFGLGLIPLSPILALILASLLRRRLRRLVWEPAGRRMAGPWLGALLGIAALLALEAPRAITMVGTRMAVSENATTRARGVRLLRTVGNDDALLRFCYVAQRPIGDMTTFVFNIVDRPPSPAAVQDVYYRVTGTPFNAVKPPRLRGLRRGVWMDTDNFDFDQGGDAVAARVKGLSLQESRLDAVVDTPGCVSYTEWTMVFSNRAGEQHEARMQMALPPGGVVSRLTLWIDGEEREAAFGARSTVKQAYKRVVQRRRDPVLVTTSGPDQVLVQCFPVPPGGTMKIRVGITAPLALEDHGHGITRLPYLAERNFAIQDDLRHGVWIEAPRPVTPLRGLAALRVENPDAATHALRGRVEDAALAASLGYRVVRDASRTRVWVRDDRASEPGFVVQDITDDSVRVPTHVAVVIDGSWRMDPYREVLIHALREMPPSLSGRVLLAADDTRELGAWDAGDGAAREEAIRQVEKTTFAGGCDNVPALVDAWDGAAGFPDAVILWLHATQPVELTQTEQLAQNWQRRPGGPRLLDVQLGGGPNRVGEKLAPLGGVRLPDYGPDKDDIDRLLLSWKEGTTLGLERTLLSSQPETDDAPVTFHIARLRAYTDVLSLSASRKPTDRAEAGRIAVTYQLVTPISGAVVLETAEQYKQAGLKDIDPNTAPMVVPEPHTWALLIIGAVILIAPHVWRRRRTA